MTSYFQGLDEVAGIVTLLAVLLGGALIAVVGCRALKDVRPGLPLLISVYLDLSFLVIHTVRSGYLIKDAALWNDLAADAARFMALYFSDIPSDAPTKDGKEGYVWILGALYLFGGEVPMLGLAMNVVLRVLTVLLVMLIVQAVLTLTLATPTFRQRATTIGGIATAVMPIFAFWAPQLLRESFSIFLIVGALWSSVMFLVGRRWSFLLLGAGAVALLAWIRQSLGVSFGFALAAGVLYCLAGRNPSMRAARVWMMILALPLFPFLLQRLFAVAEIDSESIVSGAAELSESSTSGFSGLSRDGSLASVLGVSFPRVLVGPFPWEFAPNGVMMLALLEQACWIVVSVFSIMGFRAARSDSSLAGASWIMPLFLVVAVALLIGFSISVGNYGILARFRPMLTASLLPVAAIGAVSWVQSRRLVG